jgi:hypothetical protein
LGALTKTPNGFWKLSLFIFSQKYFSLLSKISYKGSF